MESKISTQGTQEFKSSVSSDTMTLDDASPIDVNILFQFGKSRTTVPISKKVLVSLSVLFHTALESESDPTPNDLRYDEYEAETFVEMKKYMEYHYEKPVQIPEQPAKHKIFALCVADKWDADFIDGLWADPRQRRTFFELLKMANWMDVNCLLHKLSCKVGCEIMTISEIPRESYQERLKAVLDPLNIAGGAGGAGSASGGNASLRSLTSTSTSNSKTLSK
jgi:hypothetical protein